MKEFSTLTEPVDGIDNVLKHIEERIDDPVCQPLSIIDLACAEQSVQGVVARYDEACEVYKEPSTDVEENEEEVDSDEAEEGINLRDACLLLEIVERRIFG